MNSAEPTQLVKRVNETAKKSPLKVVSPIIKKYSEHRQGIIKKKLKFPRILHSSRSKQKNQIKPQLKTILPKTNEGGVIILEPELLPCALNLHSRKKKENEFENLFIKSTEVVSDVERKSSENSTPKEPVNKINKSKLLASNKKKMKCLKNIEASLELLELEKSNLKEKKEQAFVENYLSRVQQRLKGKEEDLYNQFLDLICNFQTNGLSVCDLFKKIKVLFNSHSDLCEDFVAFLTPDQALECGVFMDYLLLTAMSDFLNMIDIYFSKSPQQIKKIHSVLESLAAKPNITVDYVTNALLPLLKGNTVLRDYFLQLLPQARPPENFITDFEEVEYGELNSDLSEDEEILETIHLPEVDDHYGGDLCPCKCHLEDEKCKTRVEHCLSCSIKFINGKIFIQHGKLLKPARVVFDDHDMNYHRERLAPKLYPKKVKKTHRNALFKDSLSPTKSCNLSSDEFKSDIEEDEKGRFRLTNAKSPRINRKKSASPKHCDKILPRCILNDMKTEISDIEEKPAFSKCLDVHFNNEEEEKKRIETIIEVYEPPKINECEFISFVCNKVEPKKEETVSCSKPLDLPKIDMEDSLENSPDVLNVQSFEKPSISEIYESNQRLKDEATIYDESHSPPVISIPESAAPLFSNAKPILSLLENFDNPKDSAMILDSSEEKILSGNSSMESMKDEQSESKIKAAKLEESCIPWKLEEDRVILQTLQVEENCEETFVKIGKNIPARTVEDIKKRFAELMNILYEMKTKTNNG